MQHSVTPILHNRQRRRVSFTILASFALAATATALPSCSEPIPTHARIAKPLDGTTLILSCPDAAFADAIEPMIRSWEARRGAKVVVKREAMKPTDDTDFGVIPAASLGEWAEPGHLANLPSKLLAPDNPFQWFGLLPPYAERLVHWGEQAHAVPLTGDGYVVAYREDRLKEHKLSPPTMWEEFAHIAVSFAQRDKKPSLPPLPTDPDRLFDLFSRIASSFDRPALNDIQLSKRGSDKELLAFHFSMRTSQPRLQSNGFQAAAELLDRLRANGCFASGNDDPVAALAEGRAVIALLSLDQLARMPRENGVVPARFALAGVPGSRFYFERETGAKVAAPTANYVPHFSGGRLGVVRTRCQNADAAFDLLAEIGGPARGAELISTPGLGAGPTRIAHLNPDRLLIWLGYGFDEKRSKDLQDQMRQYVEQTVKNPTFGLRGPDRAALTIAASDAIRKIGTGAAKPADALTEVTKAWQALDAKTLPDTLLRWRQR